jgi:hypothetical protein
MDLLFTVCMAASPAAVVLGIAGIVATRGGRLNGRVFAVAGLALGALSALLLYPFATTVSLTNWEFGR